MSTDIIKFHDGQEDDLKKGEFSPGALWFFFLLTVPLMLLTAISGWVYYKRVSRRSKEEHA